MIKRAVADWIDEETFFERRRRDPKLEQVETKWSSGSSPTLLIKAGYIEREEWEKCYWLQHPSEARCWECEHAKECPECAFKGELPWL